MSHSVQTKADLNKPSLTLTEVIDVKIQEHSEQGSDEAFFVCDMGDVAQKFKTWNIVFPRIRPFYAMKCNDDPVLLEFLAFLGTGFDCASKAEIQKVLSMGVSPKRIVYANPCKQASYVKYASKVGVNLMTFDNEHELHKIKACCPNARLVLRILPPATEKVQCVLGNKFGCLPKQAWKLLQVAQCLELNVVGVSFHVGSGCYDAKAFRRAVEEAKHVFDIAKSYGHNMTVLDVGGGFPGTETAKITIHEIAHELNGALDELFPEGCGIDIISEPGRFFTASAYTLTTHVIAKRAVFSDQPVDAKSNHCAKINVPSADELAFMYYVNDGVYGSFNCMLYDHAEVEPQVPKSCQRSQMSFPSSIWGPTCDGLDCIAKDIFFPELNDGDWIYFKDMGAYTLAAGSAFNGMPKPKVYYIDGASLNSQQDSAHEISAEDQFNLHLKSGHSIKHVVKPLATGMACVADGEF